MATPPPEGPAFLGTRLRHLVELLEGEVGKVYDDLMLDGFRPRFTPIVRALVDLGPSSIRDLARALSVTHSAASQTVAQMAKYGLVVLETGEDARQRIVHLTAKAKSLLPVLDAEWAATAAAAEQLEAELPFPLSELVTAVLQALQRRPFHQRVLDAAQAMPEPVREQLGNTSGSGTA